MLIQPSQSDVRRFFCGVYAKAKTAATLEPMEMLVSQWIDEHPEYHLELADVDAALANMHTSDPHRENPFLHLSMHLSIAEQISIDQPNGTRDAFQQLAARLGEHEAHHQIMECLGEMLWTSQRNGTPPDGESYVECIRRRTR